MDETHYSSVSEPGNLEELHQANLDVYEFRLCAYYLRLRALGTYAETAPPISVTARECRMSTGKTSQTLRSLVKKGLIKHPELVGRQAEPAWVYVIKGGTHYKIGRSKNPHSRLKTLQTASPQPLRMFALAHFDDAPSIERELHDLLADKRANGEWFRLGFEERTNLLMYFETCAAEHGATRE